MGMSPRSRGSAPGEETNTGTEPEIVKVVFQGGTVSEPGLCDEGEVDGHVLEAVEEGADFWA